MSDASIVFVDGIDGSGKTVFATHWAEALDRLGTRAVVVPVDDFRCEVNWDDPRGEAEVYWSEYFDLDGLEARLAQEAADGGMVLVEGIFTLRLQSAAQCPLVYLEVGVEECSRRIVARDTEKGRTLEDVRHRMSARYFPAQQRYRETYRPVERAAVLIDNSHPEAPRILRADWTGFSPAGKQSLLALMK